MTLAVCQGGGLSLHPSLFLLVCHTEARTLATCPVSSMWRGKRQAVSYSAHIPAARLSSLSPTFKHSKTHKHTRINTHSGAREYLIPTVNYKFTGSLKWPKRSPFAAPDNCKATIGIKNKKNVFYFRSNYSLCLAILSVHPSVLPSIPPHGRTESGVSLLIVRDPMQPMLSYKGSYSSGRI